MRKVFLFICSKEEHYFTKITTLDLDSTKTQLTKYLSKKETLHHYTWSIHQNT